MSCPVELSAELLKLRDGLKKILGSRYEAQVADARACLRGSVNATGKPLAEVALEFVKHAARHRHDPAVIYAAFVDEATEGFHVGN